MVHFKSSSFSHIINLTSFHHVLLIQPLFLIKDYIKYEILDYKYESGLLKKVIHEHMKRGENIVLGGTSSF